MGSFRSPEQRKDSGKEVEYIQEIVNDDLEEIVAWPLNDLLGIQNDDRRLFGAKIEQEMCNTANILKDYLYTGRIRE